jgi:tetratricopeptide (TPR) repeat protein
MRWLSLAAVLILAVPARGQSPAEREAREHYAAGQKLFDQARYSDALTEFQQSYALSKYPALIYKIALCQDQLGRTNEALESYEAYLKADPESSRRAGVEERISKLRASLPQAAPPAGAEQRAPGGTSPPRAVEQPAEQPAPSTGPGSPAQSISSTKPAPQPTPVYKKWWLWTIVGVVAVGAAVGIGVGVTLSQQSTFSPTLPPIGPAALRF